MVKVVKRNNRSAYFYNFFFLLALVLWIRIFLGLLDPKVPSKSNKQKNLVEKGFADVLKVKDENSRIQSRIRWSETLIRIRTKMSRIHNTAWHLIISFFSCFLLGQNPVPGFKTADIFKILLGYERKFFSSDGWHFSSDGWHFSII
jgi:hypothetical protein